MLDMLKARKERDEQGFTLAELLIVVAIIAVLVAIAIPVFTSQLERSREATDIANVRSAYAEVMTQYLVDEDATFTIDVESKQGLDDWQADAGVLVYQTNGTQADYDIPAAGPGKTYTVGVTVDATTGAVTPNITVA